jgi:hypothetical protein
MEKFITKEEYFSALKIVRDYEEQNKKYKLSIYNNCSEENIVSNEFTYNFRNNQKAKAYWVSKDGKVPERDPDGIIVLEENFYTIKGFRRPFETLEKAYSALIKSFRRKKYIT